LHSSFPSFSCAIAKRRRRCPLSACGFEQHSSSFLFFINRIVEVSLIKSAVGLYDCFFFSPVTGKVRARRPMGDTFLSFLLFLRSRVTAAARSQARIRTTFFFFLFPFSRAASRSGASVKSLFPFFFLFGAVQTRSTLKIDQLEALFSFLICVDLDLGGRIFNSPFSSFFFFFFPPRNAERGPAESLSFCTSAFRAVDSAFSFFLFFFR